MDGTRGFRATGTHVRGICPPLHMVTVVSMVDTNSFPEPNMERSEVRANGPNMHQVEQSKAFHLQAK